MSRLAFGGGYGGGIDDKYTIIALPRTEADATDDCYVCDFDGAAAANEIGVGGGLTGSDLVLTQYGGVPASSDGYRAISQQSNMAFAPTVGLLSALGQSAQGFSLVWDCRDLATDADGGNTDNMFCYLHTLSPMAFTLEGWINTENLRTFHVSCEVDTASDGMQAIIANTDRLSSSPSTTEFLWMLSFDFHTRLVFGGVVIGRDWPTSLADFLYFNISQGDTAITDGAATSAYYNAYDSIVGCRRSDYKTCGFEIRAFQAALYPFFVAR